MRLLKIINEGISDVLYHSTSVRRVLSILSNNQFRLSPSLGVPSELEFAPEKKVYYMSFSRNPSDDYRRISSDHGSGGESTLVIDGRKLKQDGYSGRPIDYWGPTFRKQSTGLPLKDEMEDRLFSSEPYIDNASKYVREIHVYMGTNPYDQTIKELRSAKIMASKKNIPIFLYSSFQDYNLLTKKTSDLSLLKRKLGPTGRRSPWTRKVFAPYIELLMVDDYKNLSREAKRHHRTITGIDGVGLLRADIHNSRTNDETRPMLDRFIAQLKAKNINNLEEYKRYIQAKFDK